jgi:hypothetical protein
MGRKMGTHKQHTAILVPDLSAKSNPNWIKPRSMKSFTFAVCGFLMSFIYLARCFRQSLFKCGACVEVTCGRIH